MNVVFSWDETKRLANLRKHGLDFARLGTVLDGLLLTVEDTRCISNESRLRSIGLLDGQPVAIVYTYRHEEIRFISARKATPREAAAWHKACGGR